MSERERAEQEWCQQERETCAVASPCIGVCALDPETALCTGCLRSVPEITVWARAGAAERRAILARAAERRRNSGQGS